MTTEATATAPENLLDASADDLAALGLPPNFTLDELTSFLTKEEIAALSEGDDPLVRVAKEEVAAPDAPEEGDDPDGDDPDGDDDVDDDKPGEGDDDTPEPAPQPEPDPEPAKPEPTPAETPEPVLKVIDVTAEKALIESAADKRKALRDAYNDGEMSDDDFDTKMDELNDQIVEAKSTVKDAERQLADSHKAYADVWYGKTESFMKANPHYADATAVPELDGESLLSVFDRAAHYVTGNGGYSHLSMDQKIAESARLVEAYYLKATGKTLPKGAAAPDPAPTADAKPADPAPDEKKKTPKERVAEEGQRPNAVQTLGSVTAATENEIEDSRFAALDKAEGLDAEAAFERMSPAEQKAYLHST